MRHRVLTGILLSVLVVACVGPESEPSSPTGSPAPGSEGAAPSTSAGGGVLTTLDPDPVVTPAGSELYVNPGGMVATGDGLIMLANSFTAFPGPSRVDLFTSTDGLTWASNGPDPVMTSEDVPFADATAFLMTALQEADGSLVGWVYTFNGATGQGQIGRATAPAAAGPWTVDPEPVLVPGPEGMFDHMMVLEPAVVRTEAGLAMYYTGVGDDGVRRIGLATGTDGITWTKREKPVLVGSQEWDHGSVSEPEVVATDDGWAMVYRTAARRGFGLGLATSQDGLTWTPWDGNPILDSFTAPSSSFYQAALLGWEGELRYFLEGTSEGGGTSVFAMELTLPD